MKTGHYVRTALALGALAKHTAAEGKLTRDERLEVCGFNMHVDGQDIGEAGQLQINRGDDFAIEKDGTLTYQGLRDFWACGRDKSDSEDDKKVDKRAAKRAIKRSPRPDDDSSDDDDGVSTVSRDAPSTASRPDTVDTLSTDGRKKYAVGRRAAAKRAAQRGGRRGGRRADSDTDTDTDTDTDADTDTDVTTDDEAPSTASSLSTNGRKKRSVGKQGDRRGGNGGGGKGGKLGGKLGGKGGRKGGAGSDVNANNTTDIDTDDDTDLDTDNDTDTDADDNVSIATASTVSTIGLRRRGMSGLPGIFPVGKTAKRGQPDLEKCSMIQLVASQCFGDGKVKHRARRSGSVWVSTGAPSPAPEVKQAKQPEKMASWWWA